MEFIRKQEVVLYTVITGDYDILKEIPKKFYFPDRFDYICLTDSNNIKSNTYKIINIHLIDNDPQLTNRFYKITINKYIQKYKKSIYIDGKLQLKNNIYDFLNKLNENDMVGFKHYKRKCLYQEGAVLMHPYKLIEKKENIVPLIQYIKKQNFPKMYGLNDNCCLIRNHNKTIINMMQYWFYFIKNYSRRDQLSFMYCIWKHNVKIHIINTQIMKKYLNILPHSKKRKKIIIGKGPWIENFDPYENRKYYFNINNRLCKWNLNSNYSKEHYKFLELGYPVEK